MNKRSSSDRPQDINIDGSNINSSQLGQGENVTQIQSGKFFHISLLSLGGLGDTFPEYFDSFEKKIIGISIASFSLGCLVLIIAKSVLSDVVVPSTLIGFIIFILLVISLSFVTARIIIRYIRSKGTFWHSLEERDRKIIDAYLEKVHRGIKENFENTFDPKKNYVSLSGDVYPHQAYEEKAPKFRRQISNLDSYILSPVNKQVFIYGPPGSGKSTTLYKTFLTYKENTLHRRSDYIPVFVHANEISQVLSSPGFASNIYEFLSDMNKIEDSRVSNFIDLIRDNSEIRLVVIVDALDEFLDKTKRNELFNYLSKLIQKTVNKGTKWILSCREEEYDAYKHTLNVTNIRIKAMSLRQVEEFLRKRLKTLLPDDILPDGVSRRKIRLRLMALANAQDQQECFLKNPYYLSLWLFNIDEGHDIAIPSINELHIEELKREIIKGMGMKINNSEFKKLDPSLIKSIICVLSVLSFFLLKESLKKEFHQGIKIHQLNVLQSLVSSLVIEEDSLDQITRKRLRAYSETILNSVNRIQNNLPNEGNDHNFFILLESIYDEVFKYSSKLGFKNKQQMTKFIIVFASLIEQSDKYRLIRIDLDQALLYGFLNQRAGDYLAACFLRDSGLSKVLKEKPNFWLFRSISLALASSEKPQEILNAIDEIPKDDVFETAIANGLTLLSSKQRSNVSNFIERFTEHLLNHDRLFGKSSDPCDPLRVLRQIRRLCVNGYSQQVELSDHLFKKLLLDSDSSISESATLTYLTHSCQVTTSRKRWLFLFNFFVKRAIRFEFRESFSSLWLIIKESQT
jgi:hypothetical protein